MNLTDMTLLRQKCYIDGQWRDADDGQTLAVRNPSTGAMLGTVPKAGAAIALRCLRP